MKILISKRKLTRLSFVILCILCSYAIYLVYLFNSQNRDLTYSVGSFKLPDSNNRYNRSRDKHLQMLAELSNKHQLNTDKEKITRPGSDGNVKDTHFDHELSASLVSVMKGESHDIEVYTDTELSENLKDIHDMDNVDVNPVDDSVSHVAEPKEHERDFHYTDVGYRYYGVVKGSQYISSSKLTPPASSSNEKHLRHNISLVLAKGVSFEYVTVASFTTKSKRAPPNESVSKKKKKKPSFNNNNVPPPPNRTKTGEDKKYLVYLCDSFYLCGGWGDRQRGVTSTYLLSRLVGREFKIIMTTPCNLRLFYEPNRVQWLPLSNELVTSSNISINCLIHKDFQLQVMEGDFNIKFPQKVIYLKTNQDYYDRLKKNILYSSTLNQWGGLTSRGSRFQWAWNDLMQPSQMLLTHLQHIVGARFLVRKGLISSSVKNNIRINSTTAIENSTLICAHVRMGRNPTIPMDEYLKSFKLEYLPTLFSFMLSSDVNGDARFFVATDYDHIRSESKRIFGHKVVDYGGRILHIDRQRSEHSACVGFEGALIDQLILSLCDILVMSKSGFSMNASFMGNRTGQVYIMKDGVIERFRG